MKIDLRRLILVLALTSLLLTLTNSLYASFRVQKTSLIESTLKANQAYATKIAASVEELLQSAQQQLMYSAQQIANDFNSPTVLQSEATRLKHQTDTFNSIAIVNHSGVVLATDPELGLIGTQLSSAGAIQALTERKEIISLPFVAQTGRLLISISQPIFGSADNYLGYITGTIYLQEPNILSHMLSKHFHQDGSYVYVVDTNKRLISHPEPARIGEIIHGNVAIEEVISGNEGGVQVVNSKGVEMLAGYARVPLTNWGIVSQRPLKSTLEPLNELVSKVLLNALPLTVLIVIFILWFARLIAQPLRSLTEIASRMDRVQSTQEIKDTRAWYFETANLKKALLTGLLLVQGRINKLNREVETDPLTGLGNRQAYNATVKLWEKMYSSIAVIAIDIDHFKRVNDTYGHDVGDIVLKTLAKLMKEQSRSEDFVCRMGGEEFLILLPQAKSAFVADMAERLRLAVQKTEFEYVGHITVSIGVAIWPDHGPDLQTTLKLADNMLYKAKNSGRNRVETL
jgi:diguanylate cyclase (GGDEF)-like protein